jgi:hypothetical protein
MTNGVFFERLECVRYKNVMRKVFFIDALDLLVDFLTAEFTDLVGAQDIHW